MQLLLLNSDISFYVQPFVFMSDVFLKFMPQIPYRVKIRRFSGCFPPISFIKGFCNSTCVFGVDVLHEAMLPGEFLQEMVEEHVPIFQCRGDHPLFHQIYLLVGPGPFQTNPCTNMYFGWMFWSVLIKS